MSIKENNIIKTIFNNFFKDSFDQQTYKKLKCINENNIINYICLNKNDIISDNIKGFYLEIAFNEFKYIIYNEVNVNYSYELISYLKNIDNNTIYNKNKLFLIEDYNIKLNNEYLILLLCLLCFLNNKLDILKYQDDFDYITYKHLNYECIIEINKKNKLLVNTKINIYYNNFSTQLFITDTMINEIIDLLSIIKQQNLIYIDINIIIKYKLFKRLLSNIDNI